MINELAKEIHENSKEKGFYEKERNIGEMIALIHSELSEALEADRNNSYSKEDAYKSFNLSFNDNSEKFKTFYQKQIKGSFEEELADVMIRVMDLAYYKDIDLENHIKSKMIYNKLREYKHGKKY